MSGYAVTGAAGFIGSHLSEALIDLGHSVVGIDNFSDFYARQIKESNLANLRRNENFRLVEADLTTAPLSELLSGVSGVFHLAAQAGVRGSWGDAFPQYARDNVVATQRVFDAAVQLGLRVVYASSSSVYGDSGPSPLLEDSPTQPISPYGVTKRCCESLASAYGKMGLETVGLRYFTVYGPRQRPDMALTRLFTCLDAGQPFDIYGDGRQSRDVTFVGDAVEATIRAMASPRAHGVYNIGGGDELTLLDLIARAEEVTGIDCSRNFLPAAPGDMRRTCASTVRANRELGWAPQTELTDGLKRQWAWIAEGPAVQYGERRQTAARDLLRLWHVPLSRRLTLSEA